MRAVATVSLTGPLALQGGQAAAGLKWWAGQAGNIDVEIADDTGSASVAAAAYQRWIDEGVDILIGPYGSNGPHRSVTSVKMGPRFRKRRG